MTAAAIEQKVFEAYDEAGYRAQVRTILFNLKDKKNPDFRRRVLIGEVTCDEIVNMKSEQMASDKKREENSNIRCASSGHYDTASISRPFSRRLSTAPDLAGHTCKGKQHEQMMRLAISPTCSNVGSARSDEQRTIRCRPGLRMNP